jgi:DtxR family Mn-dependent transcriptional regulator
LTLSVIFIIPFLIYLLSVSLAYYLVNPKFFRLTLICAKMIQILYMLSKKVEDYLEAIFIIIKRKGYARTTDIADCLEVKPATVTEMLRKLDSKGFIQYRKYEGAVLTNEGYKIGEAVKGRHEALKTLLKFFQIPEDIADKDACLMEHGLDPVTVIQIKKFVKFIKKCPKGQPQWLDHFKHFSDTGEFPLECKD